MLRLFGIPTMVSVAALSVISCGGSDDSSSGIPVMVTELQITDQQQASLQGDWQLPGGQTTAFIVRSASEWNQVWAQRKALVSCDATAVPYNQAFCDSMAPPPVDFSRYALVAFLISSVFYFDTPTPSNVSMQNNGQVLSVGYRFIDPKVPTLFYTVTGRFFLVPQTDASFEARSKLCNISC